MQIPEFEAAGVELADISKRITSEEKMKSDGVRYRWMSPEDYHPMISLDVLVVGTPYRRGKVILDNTISVRYIMREPGIESTIEFSAMRAPDVTSDVFIDGFVEAFRQYDRRESGMYIPEDLAATG